jgi:hypothetical protein
MTFSGIAKAVSAALLFGWAVYTELRLRLAQASLAKANQEVEDAKIEKTTQGLSDDELTHELDSELGAKDGKSNS